MVAAGLAALPAPAAARADASVAAGDADRDAVCFVGLSLVNTMLARRADDIEPEQRKQMATFRYAIPFYAARLSARHDDDALARAFAEARPAYEAIEDKGAAAVACYQTYEAAMKRTTGALQKVAREAVDEASQGR